MSKSAGASAARVTPNRGSRGAQARGPVSATSGSTPPGFLDRVRLKKTGGSLVMTVPAAARNLLGLVEGQEMAISVRGSKVVAEPVPTSVPAVRYSLSELLKGYKRPRGKDRAWTDAPPAGREAW